MNHVGSGQTWIWVRTKRLCERNDGCNMDDIVPLWMQKCGRVPITYACSWMRNPFSSFVCLWVASLSPRLGWFNTLPFCHSRGFTSRGTPLGIMILDELGCNYAPPPTKPPLKGRGSLGSISGVFLGHGTIIMRKSKLDVNAKWMFHSTSIHMVRPIIMPTNCVHVEDWPPCFVASGLLKAQNLKRPLSHVEKGNGESGESMYYPTIWA